jgi:hypothetical protein
MTDLYLRTAIRQDAEQKTFKRFWQTALAALLVIAASELLLPLLELETLGLAPWLFGSVASLVRGVQHWAMKRKEKNPNVLHSTEEEFSFYQANKSLFTLAWNQVVSFHFVDNGQNYGLAFKLKTPLEGISEKCRKEHGVDLFLPYFSNASFLLLEKWRDQHVRA